ncbi:hypothetical protein GCM10020001_005920 [Nonomuraea salmonea]
MRNVEPPVSSSDRTSIDLRPIRSPKWPMTAAPIGRTMKPAANADREASVAASGSDSGKKSRGNTSAAAVPKMK